MSAPNDPEASLAELDPALALPHRRKMEILFAVLLVIFLSALDQTIVGVALPRIVGDLQGTNELYTWVITSYLLTATITGVFYGKLSDIFGRRLMLLFGVSVFLIGSALSGLSWSMESLIIFRGIQGVGAGAIFPVSLAIIGDLFSPRERGRYQGLFGAVFGIASILGPLLGGWLTDNLSWHWIFFVNLPIGAIALYIVYRYLPSVHGQRATRNLDYAGAAVFAVGVVFLLLGLTNKQTADWASFEVGGFLIIAALLTPVFLFIESRAAEPIVPLGLFRIRNYAVTILATFLASIGFFGLIIFLPRWFQFVRGASPTQSGLEILPLLVGVITSSIIAGILVSRSGSLQVDRLGVTRPDDRGHPALHRLERHDRYHHAVAVDADRGPGRRSDAVGVHHRHPVIGALQPPRRGHRQPCLLPTDRRFGRPRHRGHHLRGVLRLAPGAIAVGRRRSPCAGRHGGPVRQWR